MAEGVDVLTLTASPIPRTLEMALTGIRDLSMVNTPPADRRPILTYVGEQDPAAVSEAMRRELLREGQAFYVHNRVSDIDRVARDIRNLVPEARVAIAHGQMDEGSLETVVLDFWERRYDVLVCTTIIESGIDMPSVNTLIVDRADLLGPGPAAPDPRPGGPRRPAGLRLPLPSGRPRPVRAGLRAAAHDRGAHRARLRLQDRHARPRDPGGRQPAWARTSRATSPRWATTSTSSWWPRRWPRPGASRRPVPPTVSIDVPGDAHLPEGLRGGRGRPARGVPPAGRRPPRRPTSTTSASSGPTVTARCPPPARGCSRWPGCAPARWRAGSARSP